MQGHSAIRPSCNRAAQGRQRPNALIGCVKQGQPVESSRCATSETAYIANRQATASNVFALRVGDSTTHPVVLSLQNQIQARFSLNARWVACASNQSSRLRCM